MRFLNLKQVMQKTGLSKTHIYRLMQRGDFPEKIKVGASSYWLESDIENWMLEKMKNEK